MTERWKRARLGDVCRVIPGYAFKSSDWKNEGIPVVKIKNITDDNTVDLTEVDCVPESLLTPKLQKFVLKDRDILVAMTGATAGKVGKVRTAGPILLNQRVAKIAPVDADPEFIWSVVSSHEYQEKFFHLADGAAQPNMSGGQIERVEIPLPPLPVQRRIAGMLSAYDELIENSQRRIRILGAMARVLYREWFLDFRFPGYEESSRVPSPLGEIPEGWDVKPLEAVCALITDGSHHSPPSVEEGYPMASVKDMHDWGINVEGCRRISLQDYELLARNNCRPIKNDILVAKDGSYLKHTFVVGEAQDLVILSSIAILRPSSAVRPNYLSFTLRDPKTKSRMTGFVSGVAIPRIVLKDFRTFLILVPPLATQSAWATHVDRQAELCRTLVSQINNLRRTRELLLPHLLSGQLKLEAN